MNIKIKDKEYPFRLELGATRLFLIKTGKKKVKNKDLGSVMSDLELIEEAPVMVWAGLKSGDYTFNESVETVEKWLEEDPSAFDRAMDLMGADMEAPESEGNTKEKAKQ